jgi:tetratricopeptide (TPR) repeat protein
VAFVALAPAVVAAVVFAGTLWNGLVYDDPLALARAAEPAASLAFQRFGLTYLTIHAERLVWNGWAPGFHLGNVLLHAAASALAGVLALRLTGRPWLACACGLLFAVHPAHAEAVASIENRKELLAMIFVAASALFHLAAPRPATVAATLAAWALALHAKEVAAVGLALVLPAADLLVRRLPLAAVARRAAPFVALAAVATVAYGGNVLAQLAPAAVEKATSGAAGSWPEALAITAAALPRVLWLLAFPATLSADHPVPAPTPGAVLAGVALAAAVVGAVVLSARRAPVAAFALAWTLGMYLPLANAIPLGPHWVAERYVYVPSFGVCLLGALALGRLRPRAPAAAAAVLAALVLAGALRSAVRVRDWRDPLSLWQSALRAVPEGTGRIHAELGLALSAAGRTEEAILHFRRSIARGPEKADTQSNLGFELLKLGRAEEAIPHFARAVDIWPENPVFHYNLGSALLRAGRYPEALVALRRAAGDDLWRTASPAVGAALAARGLTEADFRASLAQWLAENGAKIEALRDAR